MGPVHRLGFTELISDKLVGNEVREVGRVNIILVHGLRGHPRGTWTSRPPVLQQYATGAFSRLRHVGSLFRSSSPRGACPNTHDTTTTKPKGPEEVFWPLQYLAVDIPQARVWTYGYDADVIGGLFKASNNNSVSQHGRDLALRLEREIDNEDPIIFVAHSLGGILVKDALRRSEASRQRTRLIIFLGTPHRGSGLAGWGPIASNLACLALQDSNKRILETLEVDNEILDNIHEQFVTLISSSGIRVHSFQEAQGMSGVKGISGKIVDEFSSKLGLPTIENVESINANHMQMARCQHRSDQSYRLILGVLQQYLKIITSGQQRVPSSLQEAADLPCKSTVYCNIPARNRSFVGRTEKLKELESKLLGSNDCQRLALVGLGGVGKTQVALKLVYIVKDRWPDCSIFWVPTVSEESFEQAYRTIARHCSIALDPTKEDPKKTVQRFLSGDTIGKWLLVVDNADDKEVLFGTPNTHPGLADFLPQSEGGLTLVTTRYRYTAVGLAGKEIIDLEAMTEDEARTFLRKSLTREDLLQDQIATAELLTELTYLPLAIAQAAAYLNIIQISLQEYLLLLKGTEQDTISLLSREFHDGTRYPVSEYSRNAIATTWLVSFNHIHRSDRVAADLLSYMSCIEPTAIPRSLLPTVEPAEQMVHALGTLCAYGFISQDELGEHYDLHQLVQLAVRVWLDQQAATGHFKERMIDHLLEKFPIDDDVSCLDWENYSPHIFRLLGTTTGIETEARYDLCMWVGMCLMEDGRPQEGVDWLLESCSWRQRHFPKDHLGRRFSQYLLAIGYRLNGQTQEAIELLVDIVTAYEALAVHHPWRLILQRDLAKAYTENEQVSEAIELLEHVVIVQKNTRGVNDAETLDSEEALAGAYMANEQYDEAIDLYLHVLEELQDKEVDSRRLNPQHELAKAYLFKGRGREAVELLLPIVAVQKAELRVDHPDLLKTEASLAAAYESTGQIKEATELLEHVVAVGKGIFAVKHSWRLASEFKLATVYMGNGRPSEAVELLSHVVGVRKEVLVVDDPTRLYTEQALATAYHANRQVSEALELLEHVVAVRKVALKVDHHDRLYSEYELARVHETNGQVYKAIDILEHVVAVGKDSVAMTDSIWLASEYALAIAYAGIERIPEAIELLEHLVAVRKEELAIDCRDRLVTELSLAIAYKVNGQVQEAIKLLEHVVAVRKEILAADDPDRLYSEHELALAYKTNGRVSEAINLLEHVVAVRKKILAADDPDRMCSEHELAAMKTSSIY